MSSIDPVTVEVLQNRLTQIALEAGIALQRTAASATVVEAKDLGFNICDHLARTVVYSVWMPRHGTTLAHMLRSTIGAFGPDGIKPGDMFITNDPYAGALHVNDIAVIAPVHVGEELVAWTACATHHLDVGAATPGLNPYATDWHQEGIIIPPTRLVEAGRLREDVFQLFLRNVRLPRYQALDLKGQIAANNVARFKIVEVAQRYGTDTLKAAYEDIIAHSEAKTVARIRQLPPGRYQATERLDFDRIYTLRCTLIVEGDSLTFDFAGTDPQSPAFVNSAFATIEANVHNILTCLLLPDIPANEGCFRRVKVLIPEGTLLNCRPPAACSGASVVTGWKAQVLAIKVLSQALLRSPEAWRANASWASGAVYPTLSGPDHYGSRMGLPLASHTTLHGGGARANADGLDTSNVAGSTNTSVPNVESTEYRYPILFLTRRFTQDSEGAGRWRGGFGGEFTVVPYGADSLELRNWLIGSRVPPDGMEGGKAGITSAIITKQGTDVWQRLAENVPTFEELSGRLRVARPVNPAMRLGKDDVVYVRCQGGGGFGDPLERDPALVQRDVAEGLVSPERARQVYGVVLESEMLGVDMAATTRRRRRSRRRRAGE